MQKHSKMKKYLTSALKITVACVLVFYLLKSGRLRAESLQRLLHAESIPFLALSALAFLISQMLSSIRMMFLLSVIQLRISLILAFKLTMIGNFFNIAIPGTIGGDLIKGYYLARNEGTSKGRSSGIVIVDRALGLIALCVIALASVIYITRKHRPSLSPYYYELWGMITLSVVMVVLFVAVVLICKYEPARQKIGRIILRLFPKGVLYNAIEGFALITKKRRYLSCALLISLVAQGASLAGLLNLLNLTQERSPDLVALVGASSIVMLMGIIPLTPGNIGWTEFVAALGWSAVGATGGADTFLTWRIITIACSLMGGFFYLMSARALSTRARSPDDGAPLNASHTPYSEQRNEE